MRSYVEGPQAELEGIGATRDTDGVLHAAVRCEFSLESGALFSEDVASRFEDAFHSLQNFSTMSSERASGVSGQDWHRGERQSNSSHEQRIAAC